MRVRPSTLLLITLFLLPACGGGRGGEPGGDVDPLGPGVGVSTPNTAATARIARRA